MASTTTLELIIENWVTLIKAITPARQDGKKFDRERSALSLEMWEARGQSSAFRKFEIVRSGDAESVPFVDDTAIQLTETITVRVAYPLLPELYREGSGPDDRIDMDGLIRRDARDIRDVLWSADNYVSVAMAVPTVPVIRPLQIDDMVAFQDIDVTVLYNEAASL